MRSERVFSQACNGKDAERAAAAHQRKRAVREQAFLRGLVTAGVRGDVVGVADPRIAGEEDLAGKAFERQQLARLNESFAAGEVECVDFEMLAVGRGKAEADCIQL